MPRCYIRRCTIARGIVFPQKPSLIPYRHWIWSGLPSKLPRYVCIPVIFLLINSFLYILRFQSLSFYSQFIDAGHFWVNTLESESYLTKIEEVLNRMVLHGALASGETIKLGKMYASKYNEDNMYYRCQVISQGLQIIHVSKLEFFFNFLCFHSYYINCMPLGRVYPIYQEKELQKGQRRQEYEKELRIEETA